MSDDIEKLRADYAEVVGKKPFNGWDAAELQKRIDAALAGGAKDDATGDEVAETSGEVAATPGDPYPSQADLDAMRAGTFTQYKSR